MNDSTVCCQNRRCALPAGKTSFLVIFALRILDKYNIIGEITLIKYRFNLDFFLLCAIIKQKKGT